MGRSFNKLIVCIATLTLVACVSVPPPIEEYTLARAAIEAARNVDAARYATGLWQRADESYRKGQALYQQGDYQQAKEEFLKSKLNAEKAENASRLIRHKTGEVL